MMSRQPRLRAGVVSSIVFLLTCAFLSYGQRGGGASAPRGGGGGTRGATLPPAGARGPNGRGRGQPEKEKEEELDPTQRDGAGLRHRRRQRSCFGSGSQKRKLQITEDNVEQKIELFSVENGPLSVGFVLGGPPNESRGVPLEFLKATPWTNEFFLINDTHSPPGGTVIQSFTTDLEGHRDLSARRRHRGFHFHGAGLSEGSREHAEDPGTDRRHAKR